ncbi:Protein trichome birefringence-like 26 [Camellia lanceoleosa]|uniref:Protein trichome birefringence-like 26 n=1 Tax=Camellia lanceoleosa TaxID=1840588 RepID=A0ACC0IF22_9ERIC|nr:Protein trichome birefringence-like 26 [Camellia lanceoleosa]
MKMKQMRFDLENKNAFSFSSSLPTQKRSLVVKFVVCFLLLGLAFRLFSSSFVQFSPETTTTDPSLALEEKTLPPLADLVSGHFPVNETQDSQNDPSGPYYTNQSCRNIESHQNCMKHGRPDSEYLYWRWKPRDCELPKFDPKRFLNLMRNKSWAFIGDSISRNHVQSLHLYFVTGLDYSYRKALKFIFKFITSSKHKAHVFFRTTTPDHFENGEWSSGGYCNRTTPFQEGEVELDNIDTTMRNIELEEFEKVAAMGSAQGMSLKLLDTTRLSLLRPDGHPGVYRQFQPFAADKNAKVQNDCLHWCLLGLIDSWNELVKKMLLSV